MTEKTYPRVRPVGDRAVTVELGPSLDAERVGCVRALDERVREAGLRGVLETVPTYASLMVFYDRHRLPYRELSDLLLGFAQRLPASNPSGSRIEVPTLYDGEDLEEVAASCGLTRQDVIELHSGRGYDVLMLGFSPGFAYMGFVDERLQRPRRKTPRTGVPEGSVAIAGPQTGIYPRSLPGGWNLLGRTSLPLFNPLAPEGAGPSRLMPGDRVRFVPATSLDPSPEPPQTSYSGSGVLVVEPGLLTTIQDGGRPGLRRVAVPLAGFADAVSAGVANTCVGNSPDAPLIEMCGPGLKLLFERTTFAAIAGAIVTADLERSDLDHALMPMPMNVAVRARTSNTLTVRLLEGGARAYLAIAGLRAPRLLGSASVDLGSKILRPLEVGDRLSVDPVDPDRVRREPMLVAPRAATVRVILGPQVEHFDDQTVELFLSTSWLVGLNTDRVGARLNGPHLPHAGPTEIVSDGMAPGCIQVPPDGRPIVMLSDAPTTGGYPKIACVVSDDLGLVAQAIPGRMGVRFVAVSIEDL